MRANNIPMNQKNELIRYKLLFILAQIGVLFTVMAAVFWAMMAGNIERMENDLRARLDASTQAMAAQLKANQVPFSASSVEPGVFIINQTDGTVVIDRRNDGQAEQKLWEGYKTKIIYEMQKQKRGWIEYPDKSTWNFNKPQRIVRYVSIDELNWILAVEEMQPSLMGLFKESVNPSACLTVIFIFVLGTGVLWFMTERYFDLIKRQISDSLENNLLSLNGEEKLWSKSHGQIPTVASSAVEDPIMEEIFQKRPAPKPVSPAQEDNVLPIKEAQKNTQKEILKEPPAHPVENKDKAVDVQHINSPVLKKILQQFREK